MQSHEYYMDQFEKKFWGQIDAELTFVTCLARFSKHELDDVRRVYRFSGISHLSKKQLIVYLDEQREELLWQTVLLMSEKQFQVLAEMGRKGFVPFSKIGIYPASWWRERAIIGTGSIDGEKMLVLPVELRKKVLDLKSDLFVKRQVKKNDEVLKGVNGLLNTYGVMDYGTLLKMMDDYGIINKEKDLQYVIELIECHKEYLVDFEESGYFIANIGVGNIAGLYEEISDRYNIHYKRFTKEEIFERSKEDWFLNKPNWERFHQIISGVFDCDSDEVVDILYEIYNAMQNEMSMGEILSILNAFEAYSSEADVGYVMDELVVLMNSTPRWVLKGHTPNELRGSYVDLEQMDVMGKRVGRNDPCTCGSGKKYKKCCGK